jgi:hypothetical protein
MVLWLPIGVANVIGPHLVKSLLKVPDAWKPCSSGPPVAVSAQQGRQGPPHHFLRHLAQHYRVVLGSFIDDPLDWQHGKAQGAVRRDSRRADRSVVEAPTQRRSHSTGDALTRLFSQRRAGRVGADVDGARRPSALSVLFAHG